MICLQYLFLLSTIILHTIYFVSTRLFLFSPNEFKKTSDEEDLLEDTLTQDAVPIKTSAAQGVPLDLPGPTTFFSRPTPIGGREIHIG